MHIETGEKSKHFSYPDYFTYPVSQHGRLGQRCPDNRGCTVILDIHILYLRAISKLQPYALVPHCLDNRGSTLPEYAGSSTNSYQYTMHNLSPSVLHHGAFIAVVIPYVASFIIFTVMNCSFIFGAVAPWPHYCDDLHAVSHNSTMAHCQFTVYTSGSMCTHFFVGGLFEKTVNRKISHPH